MKKNKIYNKGFTLVEMTVSLLISGAVTMSLFFIFNVTQQKFFQDNMYEDISNYCNTAIGHIASILDSSKVVKIRGVEGSGQNLDKYDIIFTNENNCNPFVDCPYYEISFNRSGLYVKSGRDFITPVWMSIGSNNFNSGDGFNDIDEGLNLLTKYSINDFYIEKLESNDFYQSRISPRKLFALKESSFNVCIDVLIENQIDGYSLQNQNAFTTKSYCQKVYNKTLYLRKIGSYDNVTVSILFLN